MDAKAVSQPLWTIAEVAAYLQVPVSSIYKMTCRKARLVIPHVRIAGRLRFRQRDIDEWLGLLSISNVETLRMLRRKAQEVSSGYHPPPQHADR